MKSALLPDFSAVGRKHAQGLCGFGIIAWFVAKRKWIYTANN